MQGIGKKEISEMRRYVKQEDTVLFKGKELRVSVYNNAELRFMQNIMSLAESSLLSYGRAIEVLRLAAKKLELCSTSEVINPKK